MYLGEVLDEVRNGTNGQSITKLTTGRSIFVAPPSVVDGYLYLSGNGGVVMNRH